MRLEFLPIISFIASFTFCANAATNSTKSRFGPREVELRMQDGVVMRGELKDLENIVLKTDYGALTYGMGEVLRITRGKRMGPESAAEIESLIKQLDSDDFDARRAAQSRLENANIGALCVLEKARKTASTEAKTRIEAIIKKLTSGGPRPQFEDTVRAGKFEAIGILDLNVLNLSTKYGDLKVKFHDVETIRWLASGDKTTLTLDAIVGLKEWHDTGINVIQGENLTFKCAGNMNLFGSNPCGPAGTQNWGDRYTFQIGAVVAKIGTNGTAFLVGSGTTIQPTSNERLFVKLFCIDELIENANINRSTGSIQISAGTGAWSDELHVAAAQEP